MDKSEEDYYKLAFETGVPQSQKPQLTDAFRKMIRLGRVSLFKNLYVSKSKIRWYCFTIVSTHNNLFHVQILMYIPLIYEKTNEIYE